MWKASVRQAAYKALTSFIRNPHPLDYDKLGSIGGGGGIRLVRSTLKNLSLLEALLQHFSERPVNKVTVEARAATLLGLCEWIDGNTQAHALVNENVNLPPKHKKHLRGFVNAILRKAAPLNPEETIRSLRLEKEVLFSHPGWLMTLLKQAFPKVDLDRVMKANNQNPLTSIRVNTLVCSRDELIEKLTPFVNERIQASSLAKDAILIDGFKDLKTPGLESLFANGTFYFQGEASQAVMDLVDPQPGETVVDLFCAPGGKLTHAAQRVGSQGSVHGFDLDADRLLRVQQNRERLGLSNVFVEESAVDGNVALEQVSRADVILFDPPCSALGTLIKHPERKWFFDPSAISELQRQQIAWLESVTNAMRPGSRLLYSVCTWTKAETADVLEPILKDHHLALKPSNFELSSRWQEGHQNGYYYALPGINCSEGFFGAVIEKRR